MSHSDSTKFREQHPLVQQLEALGFEEVSFHPLALADQRHILFKLHAGTEAMRLRVYGNDVWTFRYWHPTGGAYKLERTATVLSEQDLNEFFRDTIAHERQRQRRLVALGEVIAEANKSVE